MKDQWTLPLFPDEAPTGDPPRAHPAEIICDDVLAWAEKTPPIGAMAMLCDPPYSLGDGRKGFMSKAWDNDIAFKPETWAALARHLLPGAFGMCFASSRGWHRLACAIEDAGLIIHPSIFGWGFGSGFPKASRIDMQVDRYNGLEKVRLLAQEIGRAREEAGLSLYDIGQRMQEATTGAYGKWYHRGGQMFFETGISLPSRPEWHYLRHVLPIRQEFHDVYDAAEREVIGQTRVGISSRARIGNLVGGTAVESAKHIDLTAPATPLAQAWAGHRYGLQALKPALEPLIVWQVPYQGKPVNSITQTGAGALNIDGGRISANGEEASKREHGGKVYDGVHAGYQRPNKSSYTHKIDWHMPSQGRWPSNFCLSHLETCVRVGTQQVNGSHVTNGTWRSKHWSGQDDDLYTQDNPYVGYTDANGHETVAAWDCAPGCPVAALDAQAGERSSHDTRDDGSLYEHMRPGSVYNIPGTMRQKRPPGRGDTGGASRFFHVGDYSLEAQEQLDLARGGASIPAWNCAPGCPVAALDAQAGERKSPKTYTRSVFVHGGYTDGSCGERQVGDLCYNYGDSGNASRFFHVSDWSLDVAERLAQADPVRYEAKASRSERDAGLENVEPTTDYLTTGTGLETLRRCPAHDRSNPSGSNHYGCGCPIIYTGRTQRHQPQRNVHPTVKPIKLAQWLATLLLPPAAYAPRRILVPFAGVASEGLGAMLAGWEAIVMIEQDQGYVNIARERLAYWWRQRQGW
jgi:hypothetical protein